jgi:hypothetical protein
VLLGKNINNEWMTLRSRNATSPILIFTLMGKKIIFIISTSNLKSGDSERSCMQQQTCARFSKPFAMY